MTSWFSADAVWRGVRVLLPAAAMWLAWAVLYVYVASRTAFPVPPMRLCHVPLYAMGIVKAAPATGTLRPDNGGAPQSRRPGPTVNRDD